MLDPMRNDRYGFRIMAGRTATYPFREMQVGELRSIPLPIPAGLTGWDAQMHAGAANCTRLAAAIRKHHSRHPERFMFTITPNKDGPMAHLRRIR